MIASDVDAEQRAFLVKCGTSSSGKGSVSALLASEVTVDVVVAPGCSTRNKTEAARMRRAANIAMWKLSHS